MTVRVPIEFLKSVDVVFEFFQGSRDDDVDFESRVRFVKSLNDSDLSDLNDRQTRFLIKILTSVLMMIDPDGYGSLGGNDTDLRSVLSAYRDELRNVYIHYDKNENRVLMHYSDEAMYFRRWNNLTRVCRGLVVDLDDYSVVVHPYDKFFNENEMPETKLENLPLLPYEVAVKLDGSEGILYPTKDGDLRIITKGGFNSDYGRYGSKILWSKYDRAARRIMAEKLYNDYTFVFEIIYDKYDTNKIVVEYDEPDLKLIGIRDLRNDRMLSYTEAIDFAKDLGLSYVELEALTITDLMRLRGERDNFEGWVVRFENGLYVKVKCLSYLELHRAKFNTTLRHVFELIGDGRWDDFSSSASDDVRRIVSQLYDRIMDFVNDYTKDIVNHYNSIPRFENQKDFALYVEANVPHRLRGYMYRLRKGMDIDLFSLPWSKFKDLYDEWEEAKRIRL